MFFTGAPCNAISYLMTRIAAKVHRFRQRPLVLLGVRNKGCVSRSTSSGCAMKRKITQTANRHYSPRDYSLALKNSEKYGSQTPETISDQNILFSIPYSDHLKRPLLALSNPMTFRLGLFSFSTFFEDECPW